MEKKKVQLIVSKLTFSHVRELYFQWLGLIYIQLNLSTMATLGTEASGRYREVETKVNVWTVRPKNGRCGEVAVSGGSTVLFMIIYINFRLGTTQEKSSLDMKIMEEKKNTDFLHHLPDTRRKYCVCFSCFSCHFIFCFTFFVCL